MCGREATLGVGWKSVGGLGARRRSQANIYENDCFGVRGSIIAWGKALEGLLRVSPDSS